MSNRVILGFLVVFIGFNLYEFYRQVEDISRRTHKYLSFITIPATNDPTTAPTTNVPSVSPTFFDYVNRVFYYNLSIPGSRIGNSSSSDALCSLMMPGSVAILHYSHRPISTISRKPNCTVVMDDTIIAHDWEGFQKDYLLFVEPFWIGEEHNNCQDWSNPDEYGLIYDEHLRKCSDFARMLCLVLIKL